MICCLQINNAMSNHRPVDLMSLSRVSFNDFLLSIKNAISNYRPVDLISFGQRSFNDLLPSN